jgi:hypothetical protein
MDYSIVEMHQNPDNFTDKPFFKSSSTRAGSPPLSKNENIGSFVVLCPPDGSFWQKLTYMLGFISLLIFDGVYSSFSLLDSGVGMTTEYLPPAVTRILENLAVVYLFCYLTGNWFLITIQSLIKNIECSSSRTVLQFFF